MNNLQLFNFGDELVRVALNGNNDPEFCATDVCRVLGFEDETKTVQVQCHSDGISIMDTVDKNGESQQFTYLSEGNLFRLIAKSTKSEEFERWVLSDVIPFMTNLPVEEPMINLRLFNFGGNEIRIIVNEKGDPLFCAMDVCNILGYINGRDAVSKLCKKDGVAKSDAIDTMGRTQRLTYIDEGNLYRLIIKSNKPEAEPFERWVCDEVLPTIRKNGAYISPTALDSITRKDLAKMLYESEDEKERLQIMNSAKDKTIKALAPKAELMELILDTDRMIDIGQAAKILGLPFGRNTLFQKLREKGIFFKNKNEPKQEYIDRGYFKLKEKLIERDDHPGFIVMKVLVSQKGLEFIAKVFQVTPSQKQLALIQ